jgi:transcription antitermination factor NusG
LSIIQQPWIPKLTLPAPGTVVEEARWYAVHTRARHEKAVSTQIERSGVTTFLPLTRQTHRWSDRKRTIDCVLFDCYTFVRLESYAQKYLHIVKTPGVIGFVGIRGVGLPIPDKEIE